MADGEDDAVGAGERGGARLLVDAELERAARRMGRGGRGRVGEDFALARVAAGGEGGVEGLDGVAARRIAPTAKP